jgi:hypothetical protein
LRDRDVWDQHKCDGCKKSKSNCRSFDSASRCEAPLRMTGTVVGMTRSEGVET